MTAYRRVCDSRHPQADCQEPGSAPEPYARQSSRPVGSLYLFTCEKHAGCCAVFAVLCLTAVRRQTDRQTDDERLRLRAGESFRGGSVFSC